MSSIDAGSCGVLSLGSVRLRLRTGGQVIAHRCTRASLVGANWGLLSPGENRPSGRHAATNLGVQGTDSKLMTNTDHHEL